MDVSDPVLDTTVSTVWSFFPWPSHGYKRKPQDREEEPARSAACWDCSECFCNRCAVEIVGTAVTKTLDIKGTIDLCELFP